MMAGVNRTAVKHPRRRRRTTSSITNSRWHMASERVVAWLWVCRKSSDPIREGQTSETSICVRNAGRAKGMSSLVRGGDGKDVK